MKKTYNKIQDMIRRKKKKRLPKGFNTFHPHFIICSWFWSGRLPMAGTAGTIASLPFAWAILEFGGIVQLAIATIFITALGIYSSNWFEEKTKSHDASVIVVDEVAGMWLTALALACTGVTSAAAWATAFMAFRIFDWTKPWPASYFEKDVDKGLGVMMDDIVAGCYAFFSTYLIIKFLL